MPNIQSAECALSTVVPRFVSSAAAEVPEGPVVRTPLSVPHPADLRGPECRSGHGSVAVLGAGHGGLALAGELTLRGFRVALWNRSVERIAPVRHEGGIHLSVSGSSARFARVASATCRVGAVLAEADRVLVAVPASGHAEVARACAPYLRDHHAVLLLPGRTGGALEFRNVLHQAGCRARVLLGEANTFPFASRCTGPASATIYGTKAEVRAAALPAERTPELLSAFAPLMPVLRPAGSVLHTGLANIGAILHPTITLLNAERIRAGVVFDFYADGVTPEVADVLAAADAERVAIARAFGVSAPDLCSWVASVYGHSAGSVCEAVGGNPAYVGIKAPTTLIHRYLFEDLPTGLIPLLELGRVAGVCAPSLERLVGLAREILGGQEWMEPRTLGALGLEGLTPAQIRALVERDSPCGDVSGGAFTHPKCHLRTAV
jgi:opine dehydrogenase